MYIFHMICIIDYNAGNLTSVKRALDYLGIDSVVSYDRKVVLSAERIIFPGVGHAGSAMKILRERGLDSALREAFAAGTPVMGICLGTQIILSGSEEGDTTCVGLIPGRCVRFKLSDPGLKIPHMGWNAIKLRQRHFVFKDIRDKDEFYFVHSYYPSPSDASCVLAECEYGTVFPAAIGCKNLVATQFHPEKSGKPGLEILKNFAEWDGTEC
jgi:glutamine amidotransferase